MGQAQPAEGLVAQSEGRQLMPRFRYIQEYDYGYHDGFECQWWVRLFQYEEIATGKRTQMIGLDRVQPDGRCWQTNCSLDDWRAIMERLQAAIDHLANRKERPATPQDYRASSPSGGAERGRERTDRAAVPNKPSFPGGRTGGRGAVRREQKTVDDNQA